MVEAFRNIEQEGGIGIVVVLDMCDVVLVPCKPA
jgi:hypothetical protein